jgi:hypothetical protein
MLKIPMQTLFGAGLLLTLAFSLDDRAAVPNRSEAQAKIQLACEDGGFPAATQNSRRDAGPCRETDFP